MADYKGVDMAEVTCIIDDCDRPRHAGGLCNMHYKRRRRTGDAAPRVAGPKVRCSIPDCDRPANARGWCTLHYQRWAKTGSPDIVQIGMWLGGDAGYRAIHGRLRRRRGKASTYRCEHCDDMAIDWAYDWTCPQEKVQEVDGSMLNYSTDLNRYRPLCRPCHHLFDRAHARQVAE